MNNYGLKLAWRVFLLVLALIATFFVVCSFIQKVHSLETYHNPSLHMDTLETYYQEGQLDLLTDYMQNNGLHGDIYKKYWEAVQAYQYFMICSNLSGSDRVPSVAETELYELYKSKLTALYESCQSENRSLFETFLTML